MEKKVRKLRSVVLLLSLTFGATNLALEMLWTRIFCTVFGTTFTAVTIVLTVFLFGFGLGAAVLSRVTDNRHRPLVLFGFLEIGIGIYALLLPLFAIGTWVGSRCFNYTVETGFAFLVTVRFGISLLLLPPAFLMGGMLPLLGRFLSVQHPDPGREVSYLYGVMTIGAAVGCFVSNFLLQAIGGQATLVAAACVAIVAGLLAIKLGFTTEMSEEEQSIRTHFATHLSESSEMIKSTILRLILVIFSISGFCTLSYIVFWSRVLSYVQTTSVYSSATVLTIFLMGIADGSFISAWLIIPRLRSSRLWYGVVEILIGLSVLFSIFLLVHLATIDMQLLSYLTWCGKWRLVVSQLMETFVVLFVPTILIGAALSIVITACLRGNVPVGQRIGQVQAVNTVGSILGLLFTGIVILPVLGTQYSMLTVVVLNLAMGVILITMAVTRPARVCIAVALPAAVVAGAAFIITPSNALYNIFNMHYEPSKITFIKECSAGTVTVNDLPNGERFLAVNGVNLAGRGLKQQTIQKLQGYIPLVLHANPKRIIQFGFGCGETSHVVMDFGIEDYTVVEAVPPVFDAGKCFEEINHGSYRDPRIRRVLMDAKSFALLSNETFDIIISNLVYTGSSGSAAFFTVDHFSNCRKRLREGGLFSCRVPLDIQPAEFCTILATFQEVFPYTSVWIASNCINKHSLFLGSLTPLRIDFKRVAAVMHRPEVANDLAAIGINDEYDLLDCHMCDIDAVRKMLKEVEKNTGYGLIRNTDDHPLLEYLAAMRPSPDVCLKQVLSIPTTCHVPITPHVINFANEEHDQVEITRRFEATHYIFGAQVWQLLGYPQQRRRGYDLALKANPSEVHARSCESELEREIQDLQQALAAMPHREALAQRLADKLFIALRYPEAAKIYEQLIHLRSPPSPVAFVNLSEIWFQEGKITESEGLLNRCLERWPDCAEAHDRLGGIYFRMGRINAARYHAGRALRIDPENVLYQERYKRAAEMR